MKTVFDNRQVCHVWAQQNQDRGRSNNGNVFFEGPTIYSYGYHFPMASFINADTVIINSDSYSVSTSKQQGYTHGAVYHKKRVHAPTSVLKAIAGSGRNVFDEKDAKKKAVAAFIEWAETRCKSELKSAAQYLDKPRMKKRVAKHTANAVAAFESVRRFASELDITLPVKFNRQYEQLQNDSLSVLAGYDKEEKRLAALRLKRQKEYAKAQAKLVSDNLEEWRNHGDLDDNPKKWEIISAIQNASKIFMRIARSGDEIETSHGARFPIEHAKRAFALVRNCHDGKFVWIRDQIDDRLLKRLDITLGHFRIDEINEKGDVKAGCHFVEWDEIERMATILEIYP
jgi:hypothetical protein